MEKVIINSYEDFEKLVGQQIGISDYVELPQERINLFADATLDHQWIHVDPERAKVESPFHSTIAHGYLTLSLLPHLWNQIIEVNNLKMMINYGMDKMKFGQPDRKSYSGQSRAVFGCRNGIGRVFVSVFLVLIYQGSFQLSFLLYMEGAGNQRVWNYDGRGNRNQGICGKECRVKGTGQA